MRANTPIYKRLCKSLWESIPNKSVFAFGTALVVGIYVAFYGSLLLQQQSDYALLWENYDVSSLGEKGFLLELTDNGAENVVYIAVDRLPAASDISIREGWSLSVVSEGEMWNPRVCAKMPTSISENGDIFMLDVQKVGAGKFAQFFLHYRRDVNTIRKADIQKLRWQGMFLFRDSNGSPFFFGLSPEAELNTHTYDESEEVLKKKEVMSLHKNQHVTIANLENNTPILDVFDDQTLLSERFIYRDGDLSTYEGIMPGSIARYEGMTSYFALGADIEAKYHVDNPYVTEVLLRGQPVLSFKKDAEVFVYVIGVRPHKS